MKSHGSWFSNLMGGQTVEQRKEKIYEQAVNHGFSLTDILHNTTFPSMTPPVEKLTLAKGSKYAFARMKNMTPRMRYGTLDTRDGNCLFTGTFHPKLQLPL